MDFEGTERFDVVTKLGEGGMGSVYEVKDRLRGTRVALKLAEQLDWPNLFRFKHEFRSIADLRHPNLVQLHDLVYDQGRWFYSMELVGGSHLRRFLEWRPKDDARATDDALEVLCTQSTATDPPRPGSPTTATPMRITTRPTTAALDTSGIQPAPHTRRNEPACDLSKLFDALPQILDALEYLHSREMVHRDLKPSNVLVDPEGRVKLVDFGIAKNIGDPARTTFLGSVLGTIRFMSPEQVSREPITTATDIYALGCMLFELLAGEPVFAGHPLVVLQRHRMEDPRPLDQLVVDLPSVLVDTCNKMLAKDPAARPDIRRIRKKLFIERLGPPPRAMARRNQRPRASLDELADGVDRTLGWGQGSDCIVVTTGAEDSGKSDLLGHVARRWRERGGDTLYSRCRERESLPYQALDRIMDHFALRLCRWPVQQRQASAADILVAARAFPILQLAFHEEHFARETAEHPVPGAETEPVDLERVGGALRRLLDEATVTQPALYLLDDVHRARPDSLELLAAVLAEAGAAPLRIVVSLDASTHNAPLDSLLEDLRRRGVCTTIEIGATPQR